MVMESSSSSSSPTQPVHQPHPPQSVGREFVRQYYTLLNRAPWFLHRFYTENSSFIHGSLDSGDKVLEPIIGQSHIHEKIMQLNFIDCHTKIRQVDAHSTMESGVVIQVSGELSNNGQPMRRFMQTFVLAPKSAKKYYLHNDIFRYQDEVFSYDDPEGGDSGTTSILDESNESANNKHDLKEPPVSMGEETVKMNGSVDNKPEPPTPTTSQLPDLVSNNATNEPEIIKDPPQEQPEEEEEEVVIVEDDSNQSSGGVADEPRPPSVSSPVSNGPLTYAKLVKSGPPSSAPPPSGPVSGGFTVPAPSTGTVQQNIPGTNHSTPMTAPPPAFGKNKPPPAPSSTSGDKPEAPVQMHNGRYYRGNSNRGGSSMGRGMNRERYSSTHKEGEERHRPSRPSLGGMPTGGQQYPDSQQVFVGNLPHECSEADLKSLFQHFGKVLDIRINSKGSSVPNYGFVVFDDEKSVQECLLCKPIFLPHNNHRLNVEDKKNNKSRSDDSRTSLSFGGRPNFERGSQDNLGNRMSDRGGRGGPRSGPRGGPRGGMYNNTQSLGRGTSGPTMNQRGGYNKRN